MCECLFTFLPTECVDVVTKVPKYFYSIIFGNVCEVTLFLYAIDQVVWCCAKKLPFLPFFGK